MPFTSTNPSMHLHLLSTQAECKGHSLSVHLTKRKKVKIIKFISLIWKLLCSSISFQKGTTLFLNMRTNWSGCTKHYASSGLFKYYIGIRLTIQFLLTLTLLAKHFTLQKWTTTPFTTWMYVYIYRKFNIWSWYMLILIILYRINHKRPNTIEKLTAFKELLTIVNI